MLPRRCNMSKASIGAVRAVLGRLIMTSLAKQSTDFSIMELEKLGTVVYFTNSLNHRP